MKRTLTLVLVASLVLSFSSAVGATIVGSKHDLSPSGDATVRSDGADGNKQVCIYCHTPHNSDTKGPLWNRKFGAPEGRYASWTLDGGDQTHTNVWGGTGSGVFRGTSTDLCLSCHDGTIALRQVKRKMDFGVTSPDPSYTTVGAFLSGSPVVTADGKILSTRGANLGVNMADDHPVGFDYIAAYRNERTNNNQAVGLVGTTIIGTRTYTAGNGANYPAKLPLWGGTGISVGGPTENGTGAAYMECDTCHNVHEPGATADLRPFLRESMDGSKLCLSCHVK